jgi:tetratricopeptide (TPR) repeat protein
MLALAATWRYLVFAKQPKKMREYLLATGLFVLALLAKPSAIVLPAVVFVLDYFLIRRSPRRILPWLIPWAALSAVFAIVAKSAQTPTFVPDVPVWVKPVVAADALGFYLYKLILPLGMAIDYGRSPSSVIQDGSAIFTCLVSVSLIVLVVMSRARSAELLAAMLVFTTGLAAVLGIVPFEFQRYSTTADHYVYLSMLGPALAVGWLIKRFDAAWARAVASGVLVILAVFTMMQTMVWADDFSLFQHALEVNPDSILARLNLAEAYRLSGQPDRAEPIFRAALELHPDSIEAHEGLSQFLSSVGHMEEAVRIREDEVRVLMNLPPQRRGDIGSLYAALGGDLIVVGHYADAVKYLNLALREDPQNAEARDDLRRAEQAVREQSATQPSTNHGN